MKKTISVRTILAILLTLFGLSNALANTGLSLNFGVYTSDKPTEVVKQFKPVLEVLEKSLSEKLGLSVDIHLQVASTYQKGIANLVDGTVDFARFGPASYVLAKEKAPGIEVLAMESKKGGKVFYGIICVPGDSPIFEVSELKGKSFAFGDERSTIGRYLSQQHLLEHGISAKYLTDYEYLGRHDRVGAAVARKQFDAGALKESTFKKLVAKGMPIRAIASFPNVTKPWIARNDLNSDHRDAIRAALLEMKDPAALKVLKKNGFLEGSDDDYSIIRQAIATNPAFFQ